MTPPTTEPSRVTAGDTIAWTKSLPDSPASSGWILKYRLINAAGKIDITATAAGNDHAVSVPAATSAAWPPEPTPSPHGSRKAPSATPSASPERNPRRAQPRRRCRRSRHPQRIQEDPRRAHGGLRRRRRLACLRQEYTVAGRRLVFQAKADWLLEINFWRREVANEEAASRRRAGLADSRKVYVRF
jgi:hypothetical protein